MAALDLALNEGFTPYVKYNAKAGRWFVKHNDNETEIVNPTFAVDFDNAASGWFAFVAGEGPRRVLDTENGRRDKPAPVGKVEFKRGVTLNLIGLETLDELDGAPLGVREWTTTALAARRAIARMERDWRAGSTRNPGKVPLFACKGVQTIKGKNGDSFEPNVSLIEWIARPEEFASKSSPATSTDDDLNDDIGIE